MTGKKRKPLYWKEVMYIRSKEMNSPVSLGLAGIRVLVFPVDKISIASFVNGYGDEFLTEDAPVITIRLSPDDIAAEKEMTLRIRENAGMKPLYAEDSYYEMTVLFKKVLNEILDYHVLYIHGSAICMDGRGYLFTAPSGTGKSTHTRLWRELFGDRVTVINGDKPLIRFSTDGIYLCGCPWNGKEGSGCRMEAPLCGIVRLHRGSENRIRPIPPLQALREIYTGTYHFEETEKMQTVLRLLGTIAETVPCFEMYCTNDPVAAETAYEALSDASPV